MVIGLLCRTMNPQRCFIQTLIGLMCYAYGLRDKGFELLKLMQWDALTVSIIFMLIACTGLADISQYYN